MTSVPQNDDQLEGTSNDGEDEPKQSAESFILDRVATMEIPGVPKWFKNRIAIDLIGRAVHAKGTSVICKTCCNLNPDHVPSGQRTPKWPDDVPLSVRTIEWQFPNSVHFWTTLGDLKKSTEKTDCLICRTLACGIDLFQDERMSTSHIIIGEGGINCWVVLHPCSVKVYVWWSKHGVCDQIEFFHLRDTLIEFPLGKIRPPFGIGLPILETEDMKSPEFFQQILEKCQQYHDPNGDHTICQDRPSQNSTPTRLLHVGAGQASKPTVTICTPSAGTKYAALSHRWPSKISIPRLLNRMLVNSSQPVEFAWDDLTKTYQDAITVTRGLGIDYIWIDSLCIIQDDEDDWERESALMNVVYDGAYLTLAINTNSSSYIASRLNKNKDFESKGFLSREIDIAGLLIQFTPEAWKADHVFARRVHCSPPTDITNLRSHSWMRNRFGNAPELLHRGWCFQERIAARRVLHFTPNEYFFECDSGYSCECTDHMKRYPSLKEVLTRRFQLLDYFGSDVGLGWSVWRSLIWQYTMTRFTYDEDVFPALIYLAQKFQDSTGMTYVAGFWKEAMPECLLWYPTDKDGMLPRPRKASKKGHVDYIAPSFSWASSSAICVWAHLPDNAIQKATLVDCGTTPRGTHPLGAITSGFVRISGRLAKMDNSDLTWLQKNMKYPMNFINKLKFDAACAELEPRRIYVDSIELLEGADVLYLFQLYDYVDLKRRLGSNGGPRRSEPIECAFALILCPVASESATHFRRVGIALEALGSIFSQSPAVEITII